MSISNIHEAKSRLSQLIEQAERGEEVIIARAGKPVVKLVPYKPETATRKGGQWRGKVHIAEDFDALPEEIADAFGTGPSRSVKLLLDTHVLLWWLEDPALLSEQARKTIEDGENSIYVSAAVILEIIIKRSLGKLEIPNNIHQVIEENRFHSISVSIAHALTVESLPDHHRDPFDRILVAQAISEGMTLATRDPGIMKYPVSYLVA